MSTQDRLRAIAAEATALADELRGSRDRGPLVWDKMRDLVPAAHITTGRRHSNGGFDAYVVYPDGWKPCRHDKSWYMYNENQNHYWFSEHAMIEEEAVTKALSEVLRRAAIK